LVLSPSFGPFSLFWSFLPSNNGQQNTTQITKHWATEKGPKEGERTKRGRKDQKREKGPKEGEKTKRGRKDQKREKGPKEGERTKRGRKDISVILWYSDLFVEWKLEHQKKTIDLLLLLLIYRSRTNLIT
jgi:hypothetical protein